MHMHANFLKYFVYITLKLLNGIFSKPENEYPFFFHFSFCDSLVPFENIYFS